MNKRILILGKGFIGQRLQQALNCQLSSKKIFSLEDAEKEIKKYQPKIIINCIGSVGKNNVDECEIDKDKTLLANTFVPIILAEAALRNKIKLVHISSGCVYHYDYAKDKPIREEKKPDFFELFYSRTKVYAEKALENFAEESNLLIARIRIPLDNQPHPKNILNKLIKYQKIIDVPNSITYIPDFIEALKHLIKIKATGLYNIVNEGALRYPDLLDIYKKYVPGFTYEIISQKKLGLIRTNLVLSTKKLSQTGFRVRKIKEVLEECVSSHVNKKKELN